VSTFAISELRALKPIPPDGNPLLQTLPDLLVRNDPSRFHVRQAFVDSDERLNPFFDISPGRGTRPGFSDCLMAASFSMRTGLFSGLCRETP
jgi:hypothetical protein